MADKGTRVVGKLVEEKARVLKDRTFMIFKDEEISYAELDRFSNRCAHAFLELGIVKGDKVSIMLPNCPDFIYIWLGLAKIGAVEVPVNTTIRANFCGISLTSRIPESC